MVAGAEQATDSLTLLLREQVICPADVEQASARRQDAVEPAVSWLLANERVTEDDLYFWLSRFGAAPTVPEQRLLNLGLSAELRRRCPKWLAKRFLFIPLDFDAMGVLSLAACDPTDKVLIDNVGRLVGAREVRRYLARRTSVLLAVESAYGPGPDVADEALLGRLRQTITASADEPISETQVELIPGKVSLDPSLFREMVQADPRLAQESLRTRPAAVGAVSGELVSGQLVGAPPGRRGEQRGRSPAGPARPVRPAAAQRFGAGVRQSESRQSESRQSESRQSESRQSESREADGGSPPLSSRGKPPPTPAPRSPARHAVVAARPSATQGTEKGDALPSRASGSGPGPGPLASPAVASGEQPVRGGASSARSSGWAESGGEAADIAALRARLVADLEDDAGEETPPWGSAAAMGLAAQKRALGPHAATAADEPLALDLEDDADEELRVPTRVFALPGRKASEGASHAGADDESETGEIDTSEMARRSRSRDTVRTVHPAALNREQRIAMTSALHRAVILFADREVSRESANWPPGERYRSLALALGGELELPAASAEAIATALTIYARYAHACLSEGAELEKDIVLLFHSASGDGAEHLGSERIFLALGAACLGGCFVAAAEQTVAAELAQLVVDYVALTRTDKRTDIETVAQLMRAGRADSLLLEALVRVVRREQASG